MLLLLESNSYSVQIMCKIVHLFVCITTKACICKRYKPLWIIGDSQRTSVCVLFGSGWKLGQRLEYLLFFLRLRVFFFASYSFSVEERTYMIHIFKTFAEIPGRTESDAVGYFRDVQFRIIAQ